MPYIPDETLENKEIVRKYRELLSVLYHKTDDEQRKLIRKAFVLATSCNRAQTTEVVPKFISLQQIMATAIGW